MGELMKPGLSEMKACEVCGNNDLHSVLDLGSHPMCDDLVGVGDTRKCNESPIEILFCKKCITGHQRFQVPKQDLFPITYHYRSRFTADVLNGMVNLVETCEDLFGSLKGKKVLDIGCNDGSLLDFFKKKGAMTFGVEPTGACADAEQKGHTIYHEFFCRSVVDEFLAAYGKPDFITFTNVFAHIEDLAELIENVRLLLGPESVLVIENHYLGSVLKHNQFDTFYHEHPRTYSFTSFVHIADKLNVELLDVEFPSRYGGNIRVFLGNKKIAGNGDAICRNELENREKHFFHHFNQLGLHVKNWAMKKSASIRKLAEQHGPLRAKAFPGRAAILIKILNIDENVLSAVYEKPGSLKIGHFVPGTRIPIRSDNDLFELKDSSLPILNLAWHIPKEIRKYLAEHHYTGEVIDIIEEHDFSEAT